MALSWKLLWRSPSTRLFPLFVAIVSFGSLGRVACICDKPGDIRKTPVVTYNDAKVLCGEDAAMAAARIATDRKTATTNGEDVLGMAIGLNTALQEQAPDYQPPEMLDAGTPNERMRVLKTGGLYSRRAVKHANAEEYMPAIADILRALLRPNLDETAHDRLMSTMQDFLKKAKKKRAEQKNEGDLSELLEDLGIEDDGKDSAEIDPKVLKKTYRELSVKYHPDKSPDAAERFNRIRDAYEILSDPVKVLLYDTGGPDLVKKYEGGKSDIDRTDNIEKTVHLTLQNVYTGYSMNVSYRRDVVCRSCRLHPHLPRCARCRRCPGERAQRQVWLNQYEYSVEEYEVPSKEKCDTKSNTVVVNFERGMLNGDRVHYPFLAAQRPSRIPGDLLVTVRIPQHPVFKRIANDLVVSIRVTLYEALLGFDREIVHLDGHLVKFSVPRGTVLRPGFGLQIEGEGMPIREDPSSFGKLIVKFEIDFPKTIPDKVSDKLANILRGLGQGPGQTRLQTSNTKRRGHAEL